MKQRISFLLACVFLCLTGCRASGAEQTFFAMDTVMSVQVSGRRGPQAVAAAREAVERLDGLLSRTDSDSQIARLNTAAGDGAAVAVDPDVAELLAFSQEIARQLPGDFDITVAPVMDAWGFTTEERHVPAPAALAAAMALVDSEELSVDTEASAASLARAGMEVDLGAVAKGFAAREAEAAIRDAGGTSAMLDLGGNVTVIGAKEDGSPWRVAVKDPRDTGSYLCVLALTDVTLSTSGGYERYFEEDGVSGGFRPAVCHRCLRRPPAGRRPLHCPVCGGAGGGAGLLAEPGRLRAGALHRPGRAPGNRGAGGRFYLCRGRQGVYL